MDRNAKSCVDDKELLELLEVRRQLDELNTKFARLCDRIASRISSAQLSAALDLVTSLSTPKKPAASVVPQPNIPAPVPPHVIQPAAAAVRPAAIPVLPVASPVQQPAVLPAAEPPMVQVPAVIPIRPAAAPTVVAAPVSPLQPSPVVPVAAHTAVPVAVPVVAPVAPVAAVPFPVPPAVPVVIPVAAVPVPVAVASVIPVQPPPVAAASAVSTGSKTMRDAIVDILGAAQKPLTFEKIYEKLETSGFPLPAEKPKIVVRQTLFNKAFFTVTNTGSFVLSNPGVIPQP